MRRTPRIGRGPTDETEAAVAASTQGEADSSSVLEPPAADRPQLTARLSRTRPLVGLLWVSLDRLTSYEVHTRGRKLVEDQAISLYQTIRGHARAKVDGSAGNQYETYLKFTSDEVPSSATCMTPACNCEARGTRAAGKRARRSNWCKHAVALAYLLVDQDEHRREQERAARRPHPMPAPRQAPARPETAPCQPSGTAESARTTPTSTMGTGTSNEGAA